MDITDLDLTAAAESGFKFVLYHPVTEKDTDIEFEVYGSDSKRYRKARAEAQRKAMLDPESKLSTDDLSAYIYARCIKAWKNIEEHEKEIVFSVEAAEDLFKRRLWILDQVAAKVDNRVNFTMPTK